MSDSTNKKPAIQTTVIIGADEVVTIGRTKSKSKKPHFMMIGTGLVTHDYGTHQVMDGLAVFGQLNNSQQQIVLALKDAMIKNQLAAFNMRETLPNPNRVDLPIDRRDELKTLLRNNGNKRILIEAQIIRQMSKNTYMLNPFMFVPHENFEAVQQIWHDLGAETSDDGEE